MMKYSFGQFHGQGKNDTKSLFKEILAMFKIYLIQLTFFFFNLLLHNFICKIKILSTIDLKNLVGLSVYIQYTNQYKAFDLRINLCFIKCI